jgi:carboxymethylenebutenolidase
MRYWIDRRLLDRAEFGSSAAAAFLQEISSMAIAGEITDLASLETRDVTFTSDGFPMEAYLARPKAPGTYPGVLILHEAFGLVEHERDVARRFANQGFITLAPNVYSRVGALKNATDMAEVRTKMFGLPDAQLVRDFEAAAGYLRTEPGANGKIGCVGFCVGGRWTLLFACSSPKVDAAIDCWGGFVTRATPDALSTPERPKPVIDLVPQLNCPLYIVCGEEDQNPSAVDVEELRKRLQQAGKTSQIDVFKNAGHAFFADYRPSYREKAAFELWPKMVDFFKTHLK